MAIKIGGIDNPTEVKFVNNGTTTNLTEVWYKSSPSATAVKVWPDINQKWKINFSKHSTNSSPSVPSLYLANTYEIPLTRDLEVVPGDTITLKGAYNAVGYPKTTGTDTWTVKLDGGTVKTYSSLSSTVTNYQTCKVRSWRLTTNEDGQHEFIYNDSGTYYNEIQVNSVWTCPSELHWGSASGSTTFTDTCWWRPIFTLGTSRTISSVTLPAKETVGNMVLTGWKKGTTTYKPGASYTPSSNNETLTAVWEEKKTYSLSWGNIPSSIRLKVNGITYSSGSGSATLEINDHGYAEYILQGDGTTLWKLYKGSTYINTFTNNYTVTTGTEKYRGAISFDTTNSIVRINEYNY